MTPDMAAYPNEQLARDAEGRDAVFGHMMEFFALVDFSMKIAVHDVVANDDHAVSLVQVSVDHQGRLLDGVATEMWAVPKDPYEVDAFFTGA